MVKGSPMLIQNAMSRYFVALLILILLICINAPSHAEIIIKDAWARASSSKSDNASMYFTIINNGTVDDVLTGIDTDISEDAMIHETVLSTIDGKQRVHMRMLNTLNLEAGKSVVLAPLSLHVMLSRLNATLVPGHSFKATFRFAQHAPIASEVSIQEAGAEIMH